MDFQLLYMTPFVILCSVSIVANQYQAEKGSTLKKKVSSPSCLKRKVPVSILHKSTAGRYRPVSYPDGPITARYRFT